MENVVVIPAHNEEKNLAAVLQEVGKYTPHIIVVDDGSQDSTKEIAEQHHALVLKHPVNMGKGAALKTGCDYALEQGAKNIIVMDGDGQHEPKEIPKLLNALNGHDIVFTHRQQATSMPFVLKFGNWFINQTLKTLYGINVKDSQCGFRAFHAETYKKVRWSTRDYYMETEMIVNSGKHRLNYTEIPIETIYGDKYKGTTVVDGMIIVSKMLSWRLLK